MVKVNNLQLLTVYVLQFVINDETLHLVFSSYHWECRSGSGHRNEISSGGDGKLSVMTQVSDKRGKLHNVHITDVKRVNMTEKVKTQLKEIYNKGRKAKSLIPEGLMPNLGWNTDQQGRNRQPLPTEKQPEVTVTQTTPIQVEGPPNSRL